MQNPPIYDLAELNDKQYGPLSLHQLDRLHAAGVKLSPAAARRRQLLQDDRDYEAEIKTLRTELKRLDDARDSENRKRTEAMTVRGAPKPANDDDWLVISEGGEFQVDSMNYGEGRRLILEGPFTACHWVPREVVEKVAALRGDKRFPFHYSRRHTPDDLFDAVLSRGTWRSPHVSQHLVGMSSRGNPQVVESGADVNWAGLLSFLAKAVDGCRYMPALGTWLAAAERGGSNPHKAFADKIRERFKGWGEDPAEHMPKAAAE